MLDFLKSAIARLLNLPGDEEKKGSDRKKVKNGSMADLLNELYDDLRDAENSVTMSMALVAQKRMDLRKKIDQQTALKKKAKEMKDRGENTIAKSLLGQALSFDPAIEQASKALENLDLQAKNEILRFKELQKKVELYKDEIKRAEQLDRFNRIQERVDSTSSEFTESAMGKIESRIEEIELRSAQAAAKLALNADKTERIIMEQQADSILLDDRLNEEFELLGVEPEEAKLLGESPSEKAKKLLDAPAFDGVLIK